jgi:hypothetical protein
MSGLLVSEQSFDISRAYFFFFLFGSLGNKHQSDAISMQRIFGALLREHNAEQLL